MIATSHSLIFLSARRTCRAFPDLTRVPMRLSTAVLAAAVLCAAPAFGPAAFAQVREANVKTAADGQKKSITDFGAVADGKTMNTDAIQKAIDSLAGSGGGTLVVPAGTFLTSSIFLKPGVNLHIEKDGVLKGSDNVKDYKPQQTRIEGHFQEWLPALINADKVDHLRITGEGTIDGSGANFWAAFRAARGAKNLDVPRPRLMFISNCNDVQVQGIHFLNSGFWNLHLYRCQDVLVDGIDIRAGDNSPSTDGVDVDSCQYVTIKGIHIYNNDDGIAIKGTKGPFAMRDKEREESPADEHILITGVTVEKSGSIMTCGSEATIVRDVHVEDCKVIGPNTRGTSVLRLKLRADTPQLYEDIHVKNITLDGAGQVLNIAPWRQYFDLMGQPAPSRTIKNVTFSNIHGTYGSLGSAAGAEGDHIEDISFENVDLKTTTPARLNGIETLKVTNVKINGEEMTVESLKPPAPAGRQGGRAGAGAPATRPAQ
jgi:alpha-L-rhamnosidase